MRRLLEILMHVAFAHLRALIRPVDFGVLAVVEQDGKVVLVWHTYKRGWLLPGGAVGRGEPPAEAILRELREEIGLTQSAPPELIGLYSRRMLLATNVIALYRVREASFAFKPGLEIRAITLADPAAPPPGTSRAVRRRLSELIGQSPTTSRW